MSLNGRNGEGFRALFGVRKPPMQEPAVRMRCAMGFSVMARLSARREPQVVVWRACRIDVFQAVFWRPRR